MQNRMLMLLLVPFTALSLMISPGLTFAKAIDSTLETSTTNKETSRKNIELFYSYIDFNFDSTINLNFNRFQGHSNLYGIGGGYNWSPTKHLGTGIYVFNIDTAVNSQFQLAPSFLTYLDQTIKNQTILAHVLKSITERTYVNLAGAYGMNAINSQLTLAPETADELIGFGKSHNDNWFISLTGIYIKPWKAISFNNHVQLLYSHSNSGNFSFIYPTEAPTFITPLQTKVTWLMESTQLDYRFKPNLTPFLIAGLLQVLDYSTNNPLAPATVIGSLPQLSTNKNGYWVGGGLIFKHKQLITRLEYKYFSSAGTYSSQQALVGINYNFA